jgi:hypothetical protein
MKTLGMMLKEALQIQMNEAISGKTWAAKLKKIVNNITPTEYDSLLGYTIYGVDELIYDLSYTPVAVKPIKSASNKANTTIVILHSNGDVYWFGPKNGELANTCIKIEGQFNVRRAKMQLVRYSSSISRNKHINYNLNDGLSGSLVIPLSEYEDVWKFFTEDCNLIITNSK